MSKLFCALALAIATAIFSIGCTQTNPPLFKEEVNGFIFQVNRGLEIEREKTSDTLNVTAYRKGDLTRRFLPFYLPDDATISEIEKVENKQYICIYDSTDLGFIALFEKNAGRFFVSRGRGPRGGLSVKDFEYWQRVYFVLKEEFEDLPYADYFQ